MFFKQSMSNKNCFIHLRKKKNKQRNKNKISYHIIKEYFKIFFYIYLPIDIELCNGIINIKISKPEN